jgi:hypothetical protein
MSAGCPVRSRLGHECESPLGGFEADSANAPDLSMSAMEGAAEGLGSPANVAVKAIPDQAGTQLDGSAGPSSGQLAASAQPPARASRATSAGPAWLQRAGDEKPATLFASCFDSIHLTWIDMDAAVRR